MIRAIIFDCFGVLTLDSWQAFVTGLPPEVQAEANALNRVYDAGHLSRVEFGRALQDLTGQQPRYVEELSGNQLPKNNQLLALIKELKPTYKIGLLSNIGTNWVVEHFLTPAEQNLFDDSIFSFKVGLAKPDERIYRLACDRLGEAPVDCLMIDDVEGNCYGAANIGMATIVYRNLTQMRAELQALLEPPSAAA